MSLIYITNDKDLASVINRHINKLNKELKAGITLTIRDTQKQRQTRLNRYLIDNDFLDFEGDTIDDNTINAFISRMKRDDTYLNDIKPFKPNAIDKYDSFIRDQLSKQFNKTPEPTPEPVDEQQQMKQQMIEANIKKAREALDQAIQYIKDLPVLLVVDGWSCCRVR